VTGVCVVQVNYDLAFISIYSL